MKNQSRLMYLIIGVFVILLLSACGEDNRSLSESKASTTEPSKVEATAISETTAVLETTADGGTIEKDSEGNKITKDSDGRVVAVEDKNGNSIEITEYITTHSWIESKSNSGLSDNSAKEKDNLDESDDTTDKASATVPDSTEVEDEIPVVIATIPDVDDQAELPNF